MICLAIHSHEHAEILKNILESHGVHVTLEKYPVGEGSQINAEKVIVPEADFTLALKLSESGESISAFQTAMKMAGMSRTLLIPVDFSEASMQTVKVGFSLASRLGVSPVIMHSCATPMFDSMSASGVFPTDTDGGDVVADEMSVVAAGDIRKQEEIKLRAFKKSIKDAQAEGTIADLKFTTELVDGVAEEAILEWCRANQPQLVVMATRGVDKKEEDLIGSVTAEVLDSCRVPVLTVPDNQILENPNSGRHGNYMIFCNLDQQDIITVDTLMRMFNYPECNVTLVPVPSRLKGKAGARIEALCKFLKDNYPASKFSVSIPADGRFREEIDRLTREKKIELLIVPNKKTNVFSRIFHPTIAHKFLFERDMPMLVLPV